MQEWMKRIKILVVVVCWGMAVSVGAADQQAWFKVAFGDAAAAPETTYGTWIWNFEDEADSEFEDWMLYVDEETVTLKTESCSTTPEDRVVTIETTAALAGYEQLPPAPTAKERYKAAVAALEDGNYFVLGYDRDKWVNTWIDSGIPAKTEGEVKVSVTFAYTNEDYVAVYTIDGRSTAPIPVYGMDVRKCEFSGSGTVSQLAAYSVDAPKAVKVVLPAIYGLIAMLSDWRTTAYPGETVTVVFNAGTSEPSRRSARYLVQTDGTLVFADEGEVPRGLVVEATIGGRSYYSLAEALAAAGGYEGVKVMRDVALAGHVVFNGAWIDLNGCYIDPAPSGGSITLCSGAIRNETDSGCGTINVRLIVKVSIWLYDGNVGLTDVDLGTPGVKVVTTDPIPYCYSGVDGCYVEESVDQNGIYTYLLAGEPTVTPPVDPDAYLLDCSEDEVAAEAAKFRIISIAADGGQWIVRVTGGKTHGDRYANGYVRIRRVKLSDSAVDDGGRAFYRAELIAEPPASEIE